MRRHHWAAPYPVSKMVVTVLFFSIVVVAGRKVWNSPGGTYDEIIVWLLDSTLMMIQAFRSPRKQVTAGVE